MRQACGQWRKACRAARPTKVIEIDSRRSQAEATVHMRSRGLPKQLVVNKYDLVIAGLIVSGKCECMAGESLGDRIVEQAAHIDAAMRALARRHSRVR
jgi:hypothetical protein